MTDRSGSPNVYGSSQTPASNNANDANSFSFQTQLNENISISYQSNMLDKFDLPTYHFKFFMVGPEAQTNGTYLDPKNQVIIAESGISDYTIDDVEIDSTCQQSYESGTGTSNIFNFKITEPSGASLLDKMFYTALDLGIGNWVKSPFYLELSFRARDPKTSAPAGLGIGSGSTGLAGTTIGQMRWVWPIQISNMKANITKVGTIYDFSAAIYNEFAFNNVTSSVQQNIVLENVTTVGEAVNLLQQKLNRDAAKQLIQGYLVPDVYELTLEDSLINLPVVPLNNNKNSSRANSFNKLESKTFTFPPGTGIDNMINTILATTEYFQTKIKNSRDPDSTEDVNDSALQQLWRIVPYSVPYKYDAGRQSNAHYIQYFIVKFDKGNLPPNATTTNDTYGRNRYNTYKKSGILRKKYDYIFTGLNDQVYEFNLEFNNGWAAPTSRFAGLYYNSSHKDPGIVHQDEIDKKAEALEAVSKYVTLFNDTRTTERDRNAARSEYEAKIRVAQLSDDQLAAIQRYLDQAQNPDRALVSAKNIVARNAIDAGASPEISYAAPTRFVSDQERLSQEAISSRADKIIAAGQDTTIRPVSSVSSATEKELSDGVEDKATPGRNYTSALFAQAMAQTAGGDYGNIKLKVKGDPYWLQPVPVTTTDIVAPRPTVESIKTKVETTANFNISTNFMLIRLRTPKIFNNTGNNPTDPFTEVDTISALYSVNKVRSSFSKGTFMQDLEGSIDPPVEISKFLNEIEAEEKALSEVPVTQFANNTFVNPVPTSAIRNNPIVNNITRPSVLRDTSGNIITPGSTLGKTLTELSTDPLGINGATPNTTTLPGIDTNAINSIGKTSSSVIPGLPPTVDLTKFKRTF
jgi:hypothetical protein